MAELHGRGKVRDIYEAGDDLLMVASDRISAFDSVLPTDIPDKGRVLTALTLFWLEQTADIVPNHLITADASEFPAPFTGVMEGLRVFPERMRQNLDFGGGLAFSQGVLLALIATGLSRDESYAIVQRAAAAAWDEGGDFQDALLQDQDVKVRLSPAQFEALFDPNESVRNLDAVFDRLEKLEIAG